MTHGLRLYVKWGVHEIPIPDSHPIITIELAGHEITLTVGEWLEHFHFEFGAHEVIDFGTDHYTIGILEAMPSGFTVGPVELSRTPEFAVEEAGRTA